MAIVNWSGQSLMTCNLEIASINSQRDSGKVFSLLVLDAVTLLQNANYIPSLFYSRVAINLLEQRNISSQKVQWASSPYLTANENEQHLTSVKIHVFQLKHSSTLALSSS